MPTESIELMVIMARVVLACVFVLVIVWINTPEPLAKRPYTKREENFAALGSAAFIIGGVLILFILVGLAFFQ